MKRSAYKERKGGFEVSRGKYVRVIKGMSTPGTTQYLLMTGQFLLKVPKGVDTIEARFVRVYAPSEKYPKGKRDGTGDVDLYVGHRQGQDFQWTWSHPIKGGPFKVDLEIRIPGSGKANIRYTMGKVHY